ncbi:MAG: tRNA (adenosine(37)-N6)-threonylcarbamoyltransferase complex dimerization subunit type 1 TsaB [Candidatus Buchananbacteria bacterium]
MILVIHTCDQSTIKLFLVNQGKIYSKKIFSARYRQSEKLLPALAIFLQQIKSPNKLESIGVVTGPGPFTAIRIGISVANTLGWAKKLPVFGLKLSEFNATNNLAELIEKKFQLAKRGTIVKPFYGQEPNITLKNGS